MKKTFLFGYKFEQKTPKNVAFTQLQRDKNVGKNLTLA